MYEEINILSGPLNNAGVRGADPPPGSPKSMSNQTLNHY